MMQVVGCMVDYNYVKVILFDTIRWWRVVFECGANALGGGFCGAHLVKPNKRDP